MTRVFEVPLNWCTPATAYKLGEEGCAKLTRAPYKRGMYLMEGVDGYLMFEVKKPIPVTTLSIHGNQWMVDDPLHWIGMQRIAQACHGKVLVIGLGLGLVQAALARQPQVDAVMTYEIEPDVIRLMEPRALLALPHHARFLKQQDFWQRKDYHGWDCVVWDIVTSSLHNRRAGGVMMVAAEDLLRQRGHEGPVFFWGSRNPKYNPGCKPLDEHEQQFLKEMAEAAR